MKETYIQQSCVTWFAYQYPEIWQDSMLFAIPNGQKLQRKQSSSGGWYSPSGLRQKAEGKQAGVADLFLSVPKGIHHGLYIEIKTETGTLSKQQRKFRESCKKYGYGFVVCRNLDEFIEIINVYLSI